MCAPCPDACLQLCFIVLVNRSGPRALASGLGGGSGVSMSLSDSSYVKGDRGHGGSSRPLDSSAPCSKCSSSCATAIGQVAPHQLEWKQVVCGQFASHKYVLSHTAQIFLRSEVACIEQSVELLSHGLIPVESYKGKNSPNH